MNNKKIIGILGLATMSTMIVAPSVPITIHSKNEQDASIEKQKDNQDSNVKKQKEESNLAQDKDSNTANVLKVGNNTNEVNKATLENNQKSLENTKNQNATDVKGLAKNANTSTKKQAKDTTKNISGVSAKDTTGTSKESTKVNKDTASTTQVKASQLVATPKSTTTQNNLDNASIIIGNVWYQNIGTLSFDSSTMKFEFTGSWAETNPYASSKEVLFKISLVGTNGVVANTIDIYGGGEKPQTKLANFFNNLKFEYGDKLLITIVNSSSKISAKGTVDNGDISTKDYNVTKTTAFNLEKTGLSVFTKQNLTVNPLPIEGASNKVTSCTVTGRTVPESDVTVLVDGKTFTTKTNYVGTFSVPVTDENGLKSSTGITVCVAGQVPVTVYPSAIPNLGISKASIVTSYNCKLTGETIKFNPASLQVNISESGTNQFSANLIADGKPVAKSETSYFSGFSGSKDLKNADFKYGDIISVYQTNQAQILWNNPSINTGTSSSGLSPEKFAYYQITSKGLVPVTNANLTVNQPYYDGNSSVDVTGETKANTNVIVSVGSYSTTVRSNSTGAYTASIPESDISVGDVVSVYVDGSNFKQIIYNYSPSYALGTSKIQVSNYYGQPIFYVGFNPESLKLTANKNVTYYNYGGGQQTGSSVGTFYTNRLKFKLINSTNGNVIYNISTDKLNDATDFVNGINGKSYSVGDILEVSYNPSLLNIDTTNGKTSVSSQNTSNQYFEITNKGLVNVNNKFINVKPLNVLGTNLTSANVTGNASPNASLTVRVGDKTFTGTANSNGKFSIPITSVGGFNSSTNIVASSNGFIPTNVKLGYSSSVNIQNSHINFYNESTSVSGIQSSIGFNPSNMSFTVQNYTNSFGKGNEDYFTMGLYEANGKTVINPTLIKNGSASAVTDLLNGKSFKYGDVISLSYNPNISIPVALNNQSVIANISGATEYFEITKAGLVRVNFGEKIYTSSVKWNNGSLELDVTPSVGNNLALTNGVIEILDSSNKVITSSNINNGSVTFEASKLKMLTNENDYKFEVKLNNKSLPVYVNSNIPSNSNYKLFTNTENELSIKLNHVNYAIKSANDIVSYSKKTSDAVTGLITSNDAMGTTLANQKSMNDVITNAFINRFGLSKLQSFYNDNQSNASFLNWVLNNDVAMSEYLQATNIGQANINSLQIWSDIWNEYTNSHNGFNLKLAIATAIANEVTIHDCFNGQAVGSPVQRYNIFENINSEGGMVKGFDTLNVKLLESVVDVPITNPQIKEMRSLLLQNHNNIVRTNNLPVTDYSINYTFRNPYNGASIFGSWEKFYGKNSTVADVFKIGGVCGSISRLGSIACRVFGQPAHQMGEPGHDAFYSYDLQNGKWYSQYGETTVAKATGFDVSGWSSGLALNSYIVTYNALYTAANNKNLIKSNQYLWMANSAISYNLKLQAINNAIAAQPLNVEAWLAKINLLKSNPKVTAQDYINLSNDLIGALKDYPEPMFDLLVKFNRNMIQVTTTTQYNTFVNKVKSTLEAIESNGNESQKTQANRILNDGYMTKYGFTTNQQRLLGQININSWQRSEPTESIKFSDNNKIVATGINTWIADQGNTGIKVDFFDANMNNQKSLNINGTECGSTMANSLNGNAFTNGEIIEIQYTPSDRNHGYLSMEGSDLATKNIPNIVAIQVTKDGLKVLDGPYTAPNGKHYNFYSGFKTTANGTEYDIFGTPQKGMQTINNKKYYFNNDGIMQTGLQTIDNSGYYFNKDGVMQTGWQTIDGQSYYFNDNGYAMPGYQTIDGKKYLFANNGLEIQNIISNSNMKVSSYSTEQNNTTYSANNIIDGNLNNNWQNIWNRSDKHPYITIELSHPYNLNTLVCFPRQDGGWNGDIQKYKILISMNGKDFTQVAQGNWTYSKSNESQFANLNGVEAKYVKIESDEGISNLATISEVVLSGTDLVNKTTLKNDIAKGETFEKNAKEYSSASIQALTNALANGKVVLDNSKATKTDVNDAQSTITNAIIGLRANKEVLEKEINIAVNDIKDKNIYTDASITNLTNAISNAKVIDTNTNATVKQVENATNGLINAINNLGVNKETLENDIKKAKEILSSGKGYTQDSIDYLSHEILNGEGVIKNKNATVTDVSTAIKNLQAAIDALRANKSDLLNEISKANSILQNSSAYTSESIKVLKNFDNAAQGVLNNPKATLVQVRTAVASILSGINGLKLNETGLVNEINIAKEKLKDSSKYSKATIASLNKAVVDGENVVSNQNATPTNVKIATNDLENAIAALKPNKEGLQNAITTGKNRLGIADGYTKVSINNLSNAILSGQKVLENNNATAQEINSAIKNINTAMNALKASKIELQNAINTADNIFKNANEYTMQSIQTLSNFVIAGQAVMNNQSATPAQVRTATVSILSGIKGLKANEQGLDSAISNGKYKLKEGSKYTKVSIDALNKAILNGEEVTNNPNATVQMVEASEVSINNAIKNLVTAPVIISPSKKDTSNTKNSSKTTDGTGNNDKPVVKPSTTNSGTDKKVEPKSNEGTKTTDGTGSNDKPVVKPSTSTTNSGSDKKVEPNNNSGTKTTDGTGSNDKPVVKPSTSTTNSGTDKKVEPKSNEGTKTTDGTGSNDKPVVKPSTSTTNSGTDKKVEPKSNEGTKTTDGTGSNDKPVVKPNTSTTNSGTNSIWNEAENIWHDVSVGWHDIWFGGQNHDNSSVTKEPSKATNISSNISTGTKEDQGIVNNQSNTTKNNNKNNDVKTLSSNGNEAKGLNNPKVDSSKADNPKVNLATTNATIAKVSEPSKVQNKDENTDKDIPYGVGGAVVAGIIAAGLYFGFKRRKKDDE